QDPAPELQLPDDAGPGQQAHDGSKLVVGETVDLARQPQLERVPQLVESHQDPAGILEADDLFPEAPEEDRPGGPRDVFPADAVDDGPPELLAPDVGLGTGLQEPAVAAFLREDLDLGPADAQAAGIDAAGHEELGERPARGPREVAVPLAQGLEDVFFL